MLNRITQQFQGNSLKSNLMRGGLASIAIKIFGLGFSLLTAVVLARVLGPEQYGIYSYVLAIVSILAIPAMFGLPSLIVRETAKAEVKQEWGKMRGLWFWANSLTASLSIIIALITAVVLWLNRDNFTQMQFFTFAWGIAFIPLSALAALRGASLRGLRKVIQGQLPEQVLKPALFIIMLAVVGLTGVAELTAESAMMLNALSAGVAFVFGAWLLLRVKPKQLNTAEREFERKAWVTSVIPLAMVAGLDILIHETDIIMLGLLGTKEEVGFYRIAVQGASLITIGTAMIQMVVTPYLSRFYYQNDFEQLRKIITLSARGAFLVVIPVALTFIFFGEWIIRLVFGEVYAVSYIPLLILIIAQLIHVGVGLGGPILNMCGYEKGTLYAQVFAVVTNIVLNYIFVPIWGMEGAAWATFCAVFIRKIAVWIMVFKYLSIDTSIIGIKFKRTE